MTDTCTARIVNEHSGGTHHCVLEAGHRDPEFGTDHAGPVDGEGVRYWWGDDAIGAVPPAAVSAAVVPAADRAAVRAEAFDEAAAAVAALDRRKTTIFADTIKDAWEEGRDDSAEAIRLLAAEAAVPAVGVTADAAGCPQCGDAGACNGGPCPLTRVATDTTPAAGERRVYAWAQTIDTADGGRTVHIPGTHHGGNGPETTAIVVSRDDVPVLRAMLADTTPAGRSDIGTEFVQQIDRPRCTYCGLPHDLTPSMALACASIRAMVDTVAPAEPGPVVPAQPGNDTKTREA